jgi:short-subunit dehydrogenase
MKNVALITGGSSGIGRELAKIHAQKGGDVVLVALEHDALEQTKQELEKEYGVEVLTLSVDLSKIDAAEEIYRVIQESGIEVEYLMNNAGFGGYGKFHERLWEKDRAMIAVDVVAVLHLTRLLLPDMIARGRGKILTTSSTAAFLPGPLQATYYASKAFVLSWSEATAEELRGTGVTATALCPQATNTGFIKASNVEGTNLFKNVADPAVVAQAGYDAMLAGKLYVIPDFKMHILLRWIVPLLPRRSVLKSSRRLMEKDV